jgi:hypothetical protein
MNCYVKVCVGVELVKDDLRDERVRGFCDGLFGEMMKVGDGGGGQVVMVGGDGGRIEGVNLNQWAYAHGFRLGQCEKEHVRKELLGKIRLAEEALRVRERVMERGDNG